MKLSPTKKLASWMSSIHYEQKLPEAEIKYEIWKQNLGDYLVQHYVRGHQVDDMIILERHMLGTPQ